MFFASQMYYCAFICFFIAIGFVRGWCREIVSLVFVLLAVCVVHPDTSNALNCFLGRSGYAVTYVGGASQQLPPSPCSSGVGFLSGPFWSLVIFVHIVAIGYLIGNRVCPHSHLLVDRLRGVALGITSGTIIICYVTFFFKASGQPANFMITIQQFSPAQFVPVMSVIICVVITLALIAECFRR